MGRRPLLIVDGDNLAHRAYHSTPKTVRGVEGRPLNAITGFFGMLSNLWVAEQPRAIFVAWDTLGVPTYRHRLWPQYQAGREFEIISFGPDGSEGTEDDLSSKLKKDQ